MKAGPDLAFAPPDLPPDLRRNLWAVLFGQCRVQVLLALLVGHLQQEHRWRQVVLAVPDVPEPPAVHTGLVTRYPGNRRDEHEHGCGRRDARNARRGTMGVVGPRG